MYRRAVIEAEVRYAVRHEYAQTAIDVIARRCRLSFLNAQAALDALPRVVEIMAEELHWPAARAKAETAAATNFLLSMGLMPGAAPRPTASEPSACAVLLARNAPPAPAEIAGSAGREPTVMSTAESAVMTFGCSFVRNSSDWHAFTSQIGTCETVVTAGG